MVPHSNSISVRYADYFQRQAESIRLAWNDLTQMSNEPFQLAEATIVGFRQDNQNGDKQINPAQFTADSYCVFRGQADIYIEMLDYYDWTIESSRVEDIESITRMLRTKGVSDDR